MQRGNCIPCDLQEKAGTLIDLVWRFSEKPRGNTIRHFNALAEHIGISIECTIAGRSVKNFVNTLKNGTLRGFLRNTTKETLSAFVLVKTGLIADVEVLRDKSGRGYNHPVHKYMVIFEEHYDNLRSILLQEHLDRTQANGAPIMELFRLSTEYSVFYSSMEGKLEQRSFFIRYNRNKKGVQAFIAVDRLGQYREAELTCYEGTIGLVYREFIGSFTKTCSLYFTLSTGDKSGTGRFEGNVSGHWEGLDGAASPALILSKNARGIDIGVRGQTFFFLHNIRLTWNTFYYSFRYIKPVIVFWIAKLFTWNHSALGSARYN